jgi:hypothetical protein
MQRLADGKLANFEDRYHLSGYLYMKFELILKDELSTADTIPTPR